MGIGQSFAIAENLNSFFNAFSAQGYFVIFILMCIEGPIVSLLAAFGASFGFFNIWIIVALSFLGDLTGDVFHYGLGRILKESVIEKYIEKKKKRRVMVHRVSESIHKNLFKTIFLGKLASPLSGVTLIMIGSSGVPFKKFIFTTTVAIIPFTALYIIVGYFFGNLIRVFLEHVQLIQYSIAIIVGACIILFVLYKFILPKLFKVFSRTQI